MPKTKKRPGREPAGRPQPAAIGRAVTQYHAARRALQKAEAQAAARLEPFKKEFERREAEAMKALARHGLRAARGDGGVGVTLVTTLVPSVEDWEKFIAHVLKSKSVELLTRRVSTEAWRERLDAGQLVPGVKGFPRVTLRAT
jgi:hypothetical protein